MADAREHRYVVWRDPSSGAYYVLDNTTGGKVYGTFREAGARTRCDRMNGLTTTSPGTDARRPDSQLRR